jgi:hypothetical protein
MHLSVQEVIATIKYNIPDLVVDSYNTEILEVKGVGCLQVNLGNLKDCAKACDGLNKSNLFGLQETEIYVRSIKVF